MPEPQIITNLDGQRITICMPDWTEADAIADRIRQRSGFMAGMYIWVTYKPDRQPRGTLGGYSLRDVLNSPTSGIHTIIDMPDSRPDAWKRLRDANGTARLHHGR